MLCREGTANELAMARRSTEKILMRKLFIPTLLFLSSLTLFPAITSAQTDEIQVYDGGLADVGKFNLIDMEPGIGVGMTAGSDKLTLKVILSRDLN